MSQHQQNWRRINSELRKAVQELDGPVESRPWGEFDEDMVEVFTRHVSAILEAELNHRVGDEWSVNPRIKESLIAIGEEILRRGKPGTQKESLSDV